MKNKAVGSFIKNKRLAKNISTKEMAKHLIASEAKYLRYESGEVSVYLNDLFVIANILDVSIQELLNAYSK
ncbi:helix-turn-helix transcriptional regulator [Providencia rettgeri]|uniref:helix-turn-helix domain-containing protein n=1 Tax=Providencia TaxID=586 RepID=UPI001B37C34C|nr:helix-turn-helix transcriptional regulator [Providencia rettgeri]MBQ0210081.1 helix-turn-helix transcriptional regulator [Providencia rettgeri]